MSGVSPIADQGLHSWLAQVKKQPARDERVHARMQEGPLEQ
jgi:hypothetical protein